MCLVGHVLHGFKLPIDELAELTSEEGHPFNNLSWDEVSQLWEPARRLTGEASGLLTDVQLWQDAGNTWKQCVTKVHKDRELKAIFE